MRLEEEEMDLDKVKEKHNSLQDQFDFKQNRLQKLFEKL